METCVREVVQKYYAYKTILNLITKFRFFYRKMTRYKTLNNNKHAFGKKKKEQVTLTWAFKVIGYCMIMNKKTIEDHFKKFFFMG